MSEQIIFAGHWDAWAQGTSNSEARRIFDPTTGILHQSSWEANDFGGYILYPSLYPNWQNQCTFFLPGTTPTGKFTRNGYREANITRPDHAQYIVNGGQPNGKPIVRLTVRSTDWTTGFSGNRAEFVKPLNKDGYQERPSNVSGVQFVGLNLRIPTSFQIVGANTNEEEEDRVHMEFIQVHSPDYLNTSPTFSLGIPSATHPLSRFRDKFALGVLGGDRSNENAWSSIPSLINYDFVGIPGSGPLNAQGLNDGSRKDWNPYARPPYDGSAGARRPVMFPELGNVRRDIWLSFIFEILWTTQNNGYIKCYRKDEDQSDFELMFTYTGPTLMFSSAEPISSAGAYINTTHYWRTGLYASRFPDGWVNTHDKGSVIIGRTFNAVKKELVL